MTDQPSTNGTDPVEDDTATPFEKFERLTKNLVRVPKAQIDAKMKEAKRPKRRRVTGS